MKNYISYYILFLYITFHIYLFITYIIVGDFMNCFNDLKPCELVTLANIISITIAQNLNSDELAILAGFFTIIGDSLDRKSVV